MQTHWQQPAGGLALAFALACCDQAGGVPAGVAGGPAPSALDTVAADGVRGALMPLGFLADAGSGRRNLIQLSWQMPSGRVTVPEDTYIHGFFPLSPRGTHHIALTVVSKPNGQDGVSECDISEVGPRNVFGGAVGTGGGLLPDGLAMKLDRGSQIIFNCSCPSWCAPIDPRRARTPLRRAFGCSTRSPASSPLPAAKLRVLQLGGGVRCGRWLLHAAPPRSSGRHHVSDWLRHRCCDALDSR